MFAKKLLNLKYLLYCRKPKVDIKLNFGSLGTTTLGVLVPDLKPGENFDTKHKKTGTINLLHIAIIFLR
jgi:hypothetical protein